MGEIEEELRQYARQRVARVFNLDPLSLPLDFVFGEDLRPTFVSHFKRNELDKIGDDIEDVADRRILKELEAGSVVIRTVGDYCEHMVRCYRTRPKDVLHVLGITQLDV